MRISKETLSVLKNYATISNNLRIYPGNTLSVLSEGQSIFARITVPEMFPVDMSIHDLGSFLSILSYMDNQEIEFGDQSLKISSNGSTIEYRYSDPSTITAPEQGKSIELDTYYQFSLTAADVHMISKAIGITGASHIVIEAKDGNVILSITGDGNVITQSKQLGISPLTFSALLNVETFKVLPATYTASISKRKFINFRPSDEGVPEYFLVLDPKSVI
jgi:hypothetical protein